MPDQGELFASPPIVPGLRLVEEAVSAAEQEQLAAHIDTAPLDPRVGHQPEQQMEIGPGMAPVTRARMSAFGKRTPPRAGSS
jgi:hypothetical protein